MMSQNRKSCDIESHLQHHLGLGVDWWDALLEEALVFSMAKLFAEGTDRARFGRIELGLGLLLLKRGGDVGSKDWRGLPGGLQVPEALDDICLAELVHHSKGANHSVEVMGKGVDDGHAGKIWDIIRTFLIWSTQSLYKGNFWVIRTVPP